MVRNDEILILESQLAETLKPVNPSHNFVSTTRKRLTFASPVVVAQRMTDTHYLLIALLSVFSLGLIIFAGVRTLFFFLGRSK
jgi:hypothetical protein